MSFRRMAHFAWLKATAACSTRKPLHFYGSARGPERNFQRPGRLLSPIKTSAYSLSKRTGTDLIDFSSWRWRDYADKDSTITFANNSLDFVMHSDAPVEENPPYGIK